MRRRWQVPWYSWTAAICAVVIAVGLGGTWAMYQAMTTSLDLQSRDRLGAVGRSVLDAFSQDLARNREIVRATSLIVMSQPGMDPDGWRNLTIALSRGINQTAEIAVLEWAPVVRAAERKHFEQTVSRATQAEFEVVEFGPVGWVRANERAQYSPRMYATPEFTERVGEDLALLPERELACQEARDSNSVVASAAYLPAEVRTASKAPSTIAIAAPVYRRSGRLSAVQKKELFLGCVSATVKLIELLNAAGFRADTEHLDMQVFDVSDNRRLLFTQRDGQSGSESTAPWVSPNSLTLPLTVATRAWEVVFSPRPAFFAAEDRSNLRWLGITGTVVTALLALAVFGLGRSRQIAAEARSKAEAADRSKSAFLANMSHEIRTPMNAVIGFSHLLLGSPLNELQRKYVEKISSSGQHLLGIINDILDFSKIEAQQMELEHIDFELDTVLDRVNDLVGDKARSKGLAFVLDVAPGVPRQLVGDPLRLSQILLNFTSNAVKFTEHGEVRVIVTVAQQWDTAVLLKMAVRDTGVGLTDTQMQSLFQSFQQADSSVTRKYGGTGLGLVISKSLSEKMGGSTGVESTPGVGSTFWFTAKLGISTALGAEADGATSKPLSNADLLAQLSAYRGRRILLVEDNEINQLLAVELLKETGLVVDVAEHGARALEMMAQTAYALVLMDMQMPVMDGLTATLAIRQKPVWADLPVIAMTANAMRSDVDSCLAAGMNDFVAKPIEPRHLWSTLLRWMGPPTPGGVAEPLALPTPALVQDAQPVDLPTELPGIDMREGLQRMNGNRDLFRAILQKFAKGQESALQHIGQSLAAGDTETALRAAHTLKGVSGNIGAKALQKAAAQLETLLQSPTERSLLDTCLAETESLLAIVVQGIQAAFAAPSRAARSELSPSERAHHLRTLTRMLSDADAECVALFDAQRDTFKTILGERYEAVSKAIEDFDFDTALEALGVDTPGG